MASDGDSVASNIGRTDKEALGDEEKVLDEEIEDSKIGRQIVLAIVIICALLLLGMLDSMTTKYVKRASTAFAVWTIVNAPWSFLIYMFVITLLIVCCLPYGPLSLLMGAIFVEKYGYTWGIGLGVVCLFATTMVAGVICFSMARDHFQEFVVKKLSKSPNLKMLRNMDRLIQDGQGFEMVLLVRLAPLPTGPTYYFLGTTSVTWNDFMAGNSVTNAIFAVTDILIGAGAKTLRTDNPVGIVIFLVCLTAFFMLVCYVGLRAKRKLEALDQQDMEEKYYMSIEAEEEARLAEQAEAALRKKKNKLNTRRGSGSSNQKKQNGGQQRPSRRRSYELPSPVAEEQPSDLENSQDIADVEDLEQMARNSRRSGSYDTVNVI
jgi:uncharacterized membrane protein YdjX (TVP38/TMEM64 family)